MTTRNITTDQQIAAVEQAIRDTKEAYGEDRQPMIAALASIAKDIQARRPGAPSVALHELTRRLTAVERSRTALGYSHGAMQGVAEELIGRWAVVKMALDLFGYRIEADNSAGNYARKVLDVFEERDDKEPSPEITTKVVLIVDSCFEAGRQHAFDEVKNSNAVLIRFENDVQRREMIDAIQSSHRGVLIEIPERHRPK